MAWVALIVAGVFEWGWPVGLKLGMTDAGLREDAQRLRGQLMMDAGKKRPGTMAAVR